MHMYFVRTLVTAMCFILATKAIAQAKDLAAKTKVRSELMEKDLGLDTERTVEVEALNRIHYQKMARIKASGENKETIKAKSKKAE